MTGVGRGGRTHEALTGDCALLTVAIGGTIAVLSPGSASSSGHDIEFLNADPATTAPYSDAVRVGSTLYLAGNLGLDKEGNIVPGGIKAEAEQSLQNLEQVLEGNGSSLDRVASCEVMLADIAERDAFNEVYKNEVYKKFWEPGPAFYRASREEAKRASRSGRRRDPPASPG